MGSDAEDGEVLVYRHVLVAVLVHRPLQLREAGLTMAMNMSSMTTTFETWV